MSLFNSVLSTLSPRSPRLPAAFHDPHASGHELPLYRTPTSPRVPPPVTSTVLWTKSARAVLSPPQRISDDLLVLRRRAKHIEQQLQELLDAQSEGLLGGPSDGGAQQRGRARARDVDVPSNGSTTPTISSTRASERSVGSSTGYARSISSTFSDTPSNSSSSKPSLDTARRRITHRIRQLSLVKASELDLLDSDLRDVQALVDKSGAWSHKRARLQARISSIQAHTGGERQEALRTEASSLEQSIRQKEEELYRLKARHRHVLDDLADTENSIEAQLSTYTASLSILDADVETFLVRPPSLTHVSHPEGSTFLELPPKRRTLDMAVEFWSEEQRQLMEKYEDVDVERAALDEGAVLWEKALRKVHAFESQLKQYLQRATPGSVRPPQADDADRGEGSQLLKSLDGTLEMLHNDFDIAQDRNWNLLVCAIGAELEALRQGRQVLINALGLQEERNQDSEGKGKGKGKGKQAEADPQLVDLKPYTDARDHSSAEGFNLEYTASHDHEQASRSAIRIPKSPSPRQPTQQASPPPRLSSTSGSPRPSSLPKRQASSMAQHKGSPKAAQQPVRLLNPDDNEDNDDDDEPDPGLLLFSQQSEDEDEHQHAARERR